MLPAKFFNQNPTILAPLILGKLLVRKIDGQIISGRIVEVEAYLGFSDEAAHSYKGETPRTKSLFGPSGHAYVHRIHMQHCLDITCGKSNSPESVLIRALEPIEGIELMKKFRAKDKLKDLTSGPGKLCQALNITKELDGINMMNQDYELFIMDDGFIVAPEDIARTRRIGISKASERELRFYLKENPFISKRELTNF